MTATSGSRARRKALSISICVLALFLLLAPAASASVVDEVTSTLPSVPNVLEGDTQSSSGDTAQADEESGLGGAVAEVVTTITESGSGVTTNVVEQVGDAAEENAGPLKEILNTLNGTVGDAASAVTAAGSEAKDKVRESADKIINPGSGRSKATPNHIPKVSNSVIDATGAHVMGLTFADALHRDATAPVVNAPSHIAYVQPPGETFISRVARIAAEAARQVAFPMLLTLLVVGFLFAQSRIDGSDPKLALAPVESDHDLLSFS